MKTKNILSLSLLLLINPIHGALGDDTEEFFTMLFGKSKEELYQAEDLRYKKKFPPFPIIFHYNAGGDDSQLTNYNISFSTINEGQFDLFKQILAEKHIDSINIQTFNASTTPLKSTCNYFTHMWAMEKMVENCSVDVESGIFHAINIEPVDNEIGIDNFVKQTMSFHDNDCLSGNVARFRIKDINSIASGTFVSICNNRAIIVNWTFYPSNSSETMDAFDYSELQEELLE